MKNQSIREVEFKAKIRETLNIKAIIKKVKAETGIKLSKSQVCCLRDVDRKAWTQGEEKGCRARGWNNNTVSCLRDKGLFCFPPKHGPYLVTDLGKKVIQVVDEENPT